METTGSNPVCATNHPLSSDPISWRRAIIRGLCRAVWLRLPDSLAQIAPKELASNHMQVCVRLALHSVAPEVGKDAESVGAVLFAHLGREVSHVRQQVAAAPEFGLRHVRRRNDEDLHGHPVELVIEDDDALVLVVNGGRLGTSDDVAEDAVVSGHECMSVGCWQGFVVGGGQISVTLLPTLTDDANNLVRSNVKFYRFDIEWGAFSDFRSQNEGCAILAADYYGTVSLGDFQ